MRVKFFVKFFIVAFVIGAAGFFIFSSGAKSYINSNLLPISTESVKGASTERAQAITGDITSDIGSGIDGAKKQVLNMKISEIVNGFSRLQKIPQDIRSAKEYLQEQASNVLKSKK